jgi:periplasmic divalent cation tolerance protein
MIVLYSMWPSAETALSAARTLVEERLVACGHVTPLGTSVYAWDGQVHVEPEVVLWLKTDSALAEATTARLVAMHPYELPCVLAVPVAEGGTHPAYAAWVRQSVRQV